MGKSILLIDDSATIRHSVSYILEQEGYQLIEAADGLNGLKQLVTAAKLDLVITDINMPNMDGISFIKKAREIPKYKSIPILILTTESQGSKMTEGMEAGATGWIVKPFSAEKLLAVVKKVTE
ncbi:response regulator [Spirochaetota bacterium]